MIHKILAVVLLLLSLNAHAQSGEVVLLIKPIEKSGALQEAFNRLNGELSLHGFHVETVQLGRALKAGELERRADELGAVASVAFVPVGPADRGAVSRVELWIGDRVTGTTLKRTILPGEGKEAPDLLALQALELLRSSLRASVSQSPDAVVQGAHPERAQTAVLQMQKPKARDTEFFVSGGVAFAWSLPDGGASVGPQYALGFLHQRFGARLIAQGPLLGSSQQIDSSRFDGWSLLVSLEALGTPLLTERWAIHVFPSVGLAYLQINGEAAPPYSGRKDSSWMASLGGGLEASYRFHPLLSGVWSLRAQALLPRPVVELADESFVLGSPLLSTGLELHVFFP